MKIVVAARCYNESKNIERFLKGYDFADLIIVSDGGSRDNSVELLSGKEKVKLIHFDVRETINGETWNPDNPHLNFVINSAKAENPDWIILDDMDDVPNYLLREQAREILEKCDKPQVDVFRLYMWGDSQYFPYMNRNFSPDYRSVWAWRPNIVNLRANESIHHGTLWGTMADGRGLDTPLCLLHKSWNPETIDAKIKRYTALGIDMGHPFTFCGELAALPEWAHE
jgi:glycosyltransferase involved in cell wall biosynthesis